MSAIRMSLRKCLAMLGGAASAGIVMLAACLCAYALNGVYTAKKEDSIIVDVVLLDTDANGVTEHILQKMGEGGDLTLRYVDANTAGANLLWGRTEGVLTIQDGFSRSVMLDTPAFTYQSSPQSASSTYVLERFSSALLSYRLFESCIQLRMNAGISYEDAEAQVTAAWHEIAERQGKGYTVTTFDTDVTKETKHSVFTQVYAKSSGFVAMLLMSLFASALQWLIMEDAKRVSIRLDSQPHGRLLSKGTDMLSMLLIGMLTAALCGAIQGTVTVRYMLGFFSYCVFLGGLFLLLSGVMRANGQVQVFVPFLTLVSSLIGGCLFDLSAVSPALQKAAFVTPQGLLLYGLQHETALPFILLLALGGSAFVLSLLPRRQAV